jgi:hypothetical protein
VSHLINDLKRNESDMQNLDGEYVDGIKDRKSMLENLHPVPGSARDLYEVANQLGGYVGPDTPKRLADFLIRESTEAAHLADEIVRLRREIATTFEVSIKPLEFQYGCARSPYGVYLIENHGAAIYARLENMQVGFKHSGSTEEAQNVAERDYEERIGWALTLPALVSMDREVIARAISPGSWSTLDSICAQFDVDPQGAPSGEIAEELYNAFVRSPSDAKHFILTGRGELSDALRESLEIAARVIGVVSNVRAKTSETTG